MLSRIVPTAWLVVCTVTAGLEKAFSSDPKIGFLAHAAKFGDALAAGKVLAPAKTLGDMSRVVFNDYDAPAVRWAIGTVLDWYSDPASWQQLMQNAMSQDFSWARQIVEYDSLYRGLLGG